ncbi:hypothetical protein [Baekduia sp. Peel2402]|uniref:hypothetical protein n=1 Tax=Baekduia sp. Peel2402 TaxID=3458296 RepID=UPI00403E717B
MSNLPTPSSTLPITPTYRARKRRAKRGIVANYIHEISPRHRASEPVTATATATAVASVPAVAPAAITTAIAAEPSAG